MNSEEAKIIISIICKADSGCPCCVSDLMEEWNKNFPNFQAFETDKYATWKLKEVGEE